MPKKTRFCAAGIWRAAQVVASALHKTRTNFISEFASREFESPRNCSCKMNNMRFGTHKNSRADAIQSTLHAIVAIVFGCVFAGFGLTFLTTFIHGGAKLDASSLFFVALPSLFILIGLTQVVAAVRFLWVNAKRGDVDVALAPEPAVEGEELNVVLKFSKRFDAAREIKLHLVGYTDRDSESIDTSEIAHTTGRLIARTQSLALRLRVPLGTKEKGTHRYALRVKVVGFERVPIERSIMIESASAAQWSPSIHTTTLAANPSATASQPRPYRVELATKGLKIVGFGLIVFGSLFALFGGARRLIAALGETSSFGWFSVLHSIPFVLAGGAVVGFGVIIFTLRRSVSIDREGITVMTTSLAFALDKQFFPAEQITALAPCVASELHAPSNKSTRYGLAIRAGPRWHALPLNLSVASPTDPALREMAATIARLFGRLDIAFDTEPVAASDVAARVQASSGGSGRAQVIRRAALTAFLWLAAVVSFDHFVVGNAWAYHSTANVRAALSPQSKLKTEPLETPIQPLAATGNRLLTQPEFEFDRSNQTFRFIGRRSPFIVRVDASWTFQNSALTINADRIEIDHATLECPWTQCEPITHLRFRLHSAAPEGLKARGGLSDDFVLNPPIAYGERRVIRNAQFRFPFADPPTTLAYRIPQLDIGAIYGDNRHTMGPVGPQRGLPFAESAAGLSRPCERVNTLTEAITWECAQARDRLLIANPGRTDTPDKVPGESQLRSALEHAVLTSDRESVAALIAAGADVRRINAEKETPLSYAVWRGDGAVVDALVKAGASVNEALPTKDGRRSVSVLHSAIYQDNPEMVKRLVEMGADLKTANASGWTGYTLALHNKSGTEMVKAMLESGRAAVDEKVRMPRAKWGELDVSPLLVAIAFNRAETVKLLIAQRADSDRPGPFGFPEGHFAAYYGHVESLRALREAGVDLLAPIPNGRQHAGATYLMHATHGGNQAAVEYLLSLGADTRQKDAAGRDARDHARAYNHAHLLKILDSRESAALPKN